MLVYMADNKHKSCNWYSLLLEVGMLQVSSTTGGGHHKVYIVMNSGQYHPDVMHDGVIKLCVHILVYNLM